MKVLVAGANGFVGINITRYLLERGHNVVMTFRNRLTEENEKIIEPYKDKVEMETGDLLDGSLYEKLDRYEVDGIINAAIYTSTSENELDFFIPVCKVNMMSNINLMEYAIRHQVKKYIYVSSSGVYGSASNIEDIVTEDSTLNLPDAYDRTKVASELLVTRMAELTGMQAASARIAAPYGPAERMTGGRVFMSPPYKMLHMALNGEKACICGKDYQRDWTYVEDTAAGICGLLLAEKLNYTVYNVSSSMNASLETMAQAVKKCCPDFEYEFTDRREESNIFADLEDMRGALSVERLSEDTSYKTEYDIFAGIEAYYRSFQK